MALIRNIAGFTVGSTAPMTSVTQNNGTATTAGVTALYSVMNTFGPAVANAIVPGSGMLIKIQDQLISLLPPGGFKNFAQDFKFGAIPGIIKMIVGLPYTEGQGKLAERFSDQVLGNPDIGYRDAYITTDLIKQAQLAFTSLFGVRITTGEDLDALDYGNAAYYARPDKTDIPEKAVNRAVMLKQKYYPMLTYNRGPWDLSHFGEFPLVSPIPDPWNVGRLYNGPLPGGGTAIDGVLDLTGAQLQSAAGSGQATAGINWLLWAGLALAAYAGYRYSKNPKQKLKWTI